MGFLVRSTRIGRGECVHFRVADVEPLDALWHRYEATRGPITKTAFLRQLILLAAAQLKADLDGAQQPPRPVQYPAQEE